MQMTTPEIKPIKAKRVNPMMGDERQYTKGWRARMTTPLVNMAPDRIHGLDPHFQKGWLNANQMRIAKWIRNLCMGGEFANADQVQKAYRLRLDAPVLSPSQC